MTHLGTGTRLARRAAFPAAAVAVIALHVGLVFQFLPPSIAFGPEPIHGLDFEFHASEVWTVTDSLDTWGKSWAWNPHLLAGYPEGTVFDTDSKALELFVFSLWKIGMPRHLAFNLFTLLAHLLLLPAVYAAARLFGLGRWAALGSVLAASLLWHFDSFAHCLWWVGMVSYAMSSYGLLIPLALFFRYLGSRRPRYLLLLGLSLGIVHLVHPFSFTSLVVPMTFMYVLGFRSLRWKEHLGIAAVCLFTIAVNSWWLAVLVRFSSDIVPIDAFCQADPSYFMSDLLGIERNRLITGWCGMSTMFRSCVIVAAAACLFRWGGKRDPRLPGLGLGIGATLAIAYAGSFVYPLAQTQPYRHILPAMMLCTIPAAAAVEELVRSRSWPTQLSTRFLAITLLCLLPAVAVLRDAAPFFPAASFGGKCPPATDCCRHVPLRQDQQLTVDYVSALDHSAGRILVEDWTLAEQLARVSGAQVLGGFGFRNMRHSAANLFTRHRDRSGDSRELEQYLAEYAVRWVLVRKPHPEIDGRPDLFTLRGALPFRIGNSIQRHRLYVVNRSSGFIVSGLGSAEAALNRITVSGTDPLADVVLRFHFLESFRCAPDCTLVREPIRGDPVGFIRVPAPHPPDFRIYNSY